MTVEISKGCADNLAKGKGTAKVTIGSINTISFGDGTGTGSTDEILDSGNGLGGVSVGDMVTVVTQSGTNDITTEALAVSAGAIEVVAGSFTTESAATAGYCSVVSHRGHSLADIFKYGVIRIYGTPRPASPQDTEGAATLLLEISESGGAFSGGSDTNGLLWDSVVDGVLSKDTSQTWSDTVLATGTAVWGRIYDNAFNTGADAGETYNRIDFDIGSDLDMAASMTLGNVRTIDTFDIQVPLT